MPDGTIGGGLNPTSAPECLRSIHRGELGVRTALSSPGGEGKIGIGEPHFLASIMCLHLDLEQTTPIMKV